ncbi:MAG: winged helix-turn-helix domain-containing protein [Candidatus Woesearchaeota archaeon]
MDGIFSKYHKGIKAGFIAGITIIGGLIGGVANQLGINSLRYDYGYYHVIDKTASEHQIMPEGSNASMEVEKARIANVHNSRGNLLGRMGIGGMRGYEESTGFNASLDAFNTSLAQKTVSEWNAMHPNARLSWTSPPASDNPHLQQANSAYNNGIAYVDAHKDSLTEQVRAYRQNNPARNGNYGTGWAALFSAALVGGAAAIGPGKTPNPHNSPNRINLKPSYKRRGRNEEEGAGNRRDDYHGSIQKNLDEIIIPITPSSNQLESITTDSFVEEPTNSKYNYDEGAFRIKNSMQWEYIKTKTLAPGKEYSLSEHNLKQVFKRGENISSAYNLRNNGMTVREIAERLGKSKSTVYKYIREAKLIESTGEKEGNENPPSQDQEAIYANAAD